MHLERTQRKSAFTFSEPAAAFRKMLQWFAKTFEAVVETNAPGSLPIENGEFARFRVSEKSICLTGQAQSAIEEANFCAKGFKPLLRQNPENRKDLLELRTWGGV